MSEYGPLLLAGLPGLGALIMSSWQFLAKRNVEHLDKTLEQLAKAVADLRTAVNSVGTELGAKIVDLRLTDMAQQKDLGALQGRLEGLERRVDGQGVHYQQRIEKLVERLEDIRK